jgi:PAS domain S-box-containing protein
MSKKINILLVEDNPGDVRLLDVYLKDFFRSDFSISSAASLSTALSFLQKNIFNIIILDLNLPDSFGLDTFKTVYQNSPEIPIIVLTGQEDESTGISAMQLGAQDFLIKGEVKGKELARSISYSIERYKLLKELSENTKKLEEQTIILHQERLKLADAQKLAHIGSWELNLTTNALTWSDELYRIYGMQPQEKLIDAEIVYAIIHPNDRLYVKKIIQESIIKNKSFAFYYRIVFPNKTIKTIHAKGEIITDDSGKAIKIIGTDQDVTERIHEEEMEKLALAATQSYNSVIIANKDGKIEWVNEGFTKLTGYSLEEVLNTHGELLRKGGNTGLNRNDFYETIIKEKKPVVYESKNFSKSGKQYWVITTLTPIIGANGEVEKIIAIDSDITLRKQMEQDLVHANKIAEHSLMKGNKALNELKKAKKELEDSMKVKEQFLANMSHEIRTPMNAIVGFTNLISKTELNDEQKKYIDAIKTSGENLLVIINDILDFSKIQSGKLLLEKIEFNLPEVISGLSKIMDEKLKEKKLELITKIDTNVPKLIVGDPIRLNQILLNLVGNAIKFTEVGEIRVEVNLIAEEVDFWNIQFFVIDTGIGIPAEKQNVIFDGFTQASNETTRKYGGTGLGLTIVKQLVELHGGNISVESELGMGAAFVFNLKFDKHCSSNQINGTSVIENENLPDKTKKLKILLVEDNLLNQILAKKVLSDWEWDVQVAENGIQAIKLLEQENFDVILMDIQMPEMDGYETTQIIRRNNDSFKAETPIIAMTAHAMSGEAKKCINAGMDDYVSKPFEAKELYSKIISTYQKKQSKNGKQ